MGGTDVGASFSGSSSATSGLQGNFSKIFGDKIAGSKPNPWLVGGVILAAVVIAAIFAATKGK